MYQYKPLPESVLEGMKRHKEKSDCTVKALALAYGTSYDWAHAVLKAYGRQRGKGLYTHQVFPQVFKDMEIKHKIGPYTRKERISLKKFCEKHPKGRYVVCSSGHAMAVVDGVVYDWGDKPRRLVVWAVRIHKEGE